MDNSKETHTQRIFKGSFTVLFFALLSSPIGYILRIFYSQTLSIESFGLFYAVLALFNTIATYNDLGFGFSTSYFLPKYFKKKDFQTCWKLYKYDQFIEVGTAIILSGVLVLVAPWLAANFFHLPLATNIIYIFCIYLIANSFLSAQNRLFNGLQQEKYYSSMHVIRLSLTLLFSVLFWIFDFPFATFYAIAIAAAFIMAAFVYNYFLFKKNPFLKKQTLKWDKKLFSSMQSYALPTLATTSVFSFIVFTDTFFLTLFKGVKEVGVYNIVLPLVSISSIFLSPINALLFPLISHLMEGEKEKVNILLESILKVIPFIALYFGLFIAIFPSASITLLFGQKWLGLAEVPLTILSIGFISSTVSSYLTTIIAGTGKVKERLKISIIIAIASVTLNCVLVYFYGVTGAVIANSLVYLLSVLLFGKIIYKEFPFKYPLIYYLKLVVFSGLLYYLIKVIAFYPVTWSQFIWAGSVYSIIMALFAYHLKLFDKDMIKSVLNFTKDEPSLPDKLGSLRLSSKDNNEK